MVINLQFKKMTGFSGNVPWILRLCTLDSPVLGQHMGQIPQDGNFGENVAYFF